MRASFDALLIRGVIRSRLLVNALVDPDEAAERLPAGLRPHVIGGRTIVGCCLLEISAIRPTPLPAALGRTVRAAAHRIAVEWTDDDSVPNTGVYVPLRVTDSALAAAAGGRVFPGVHAPAAIRLSDHGSEVRWSIDAGEYSVSVGVAVPEVAPAGACEPIGGSCLGADVGLSPRRDGKLEGARMTPRHRRAVAVDVQHLDSVFLSSFASAVSAPSYLMRDVDVTWTRADAPTRRSAEVSA